MPRNMKHEPIIGTTRTDAAAAGNHRRAVEQKPDAGQKPGDSSAIEDDGEHGSRDDGGGEAGDELASRPGEKRDLEAPAISWPRRRVRWPWR